eukprot:1348893-Lingulodinium_polyedra.AAC.1
MHPIAAAPRILRFARSMRRPPRGGRRMEYVHCELRGTATTHCIAERISEQLRATTAQKCVQICIWSFRNSRTTTMWLSTHGTRIAK